MHATPQWMMALDAAAAAYTKRQLAWLPHDHRGRWLVMEPGAGRYLKGHPKHVREIVDAGSMRRARRFSSLSAARAFARSVGGTVAHWRRTPPSGGVWGKQHLWERVMAQGTYAFPLSRLVAEQLTENPE